MRKLIFYVILICGFNGFAKDSLIVNNSSKKWQLELTCSYNYNYRKVGQITDNASYGLDIINNYIDTGNVACYSKNVGILITRKNLEIFRFPNRDILW
jgi:DNA polymerase III sliding clamp (beta) subunit (PCNA family)